MGNVSENTCLVCDSINTFSKKVCQETFNIYKSLLNCDSEKVLYLLTCKVCGKVPYFQEL